MNFKSKNSFQSLDKFDISGKTYHFYNLSKAEKNGLNGIKKLPKSLKVLLENLLRFEDDITVNKKKICGILNETVFYNDLKFLVIGIGINIVSSPNIRDYPTTNLNEITNKTVSKTKLFNKIVKAFDIKIK